MVVRGIERDGKWVDGKVVKNKKKLKWVGILREKEGALKNEQQKMKAMVKVCVKFII